MKFTSRILVAAMALTVSTVVATAQEQGRRGGDRPNFEEFRQRMNERMKTSLKVSDDEWAVLQPLIERVQTKQRESLGSRFGGFGRGGGDRGGSSGGGGGDRDRGGSPESQALRTALENENASPEELKSKLSAVREARKRSAAELEAAREELRKVVTVRQEAVLVAMGVLE